jgi:hypothetical protein
VGEIAALKDDAGKIGFGENGVAQIAGLKAHRIESGEAKIALSNVQS